MRNCAPDQILLIVTQTVGQRIQIEPFGAADFKTLWARDSVRGAAEDYLDLSIFLKRANEGDAFNFDLKADLFAQLTADRLIRLFARTHKTAGNAPSGAGTKSVMEQQDSLARIDNHRAYSYCKT